MKAEPLEDQLVEWLRDFRPDSDLRQLVLDAIRAEARARAGDQPDRRRDLLAQLERLQDLYVMVDLTRGQYTMRRQALEQEVERIGPPIRQSPVKRSRFRPSGRTEVTRLRDSLDALFVRADDGAKPGTDLEADMNRYLCVRISGFLERAATSCCRALCEAEGRGPSLSFPLAHLDRSPNPRADELLKLVGKFDSTWATEFEVLLDEDERRARVNALLGIRNDVAHGRNQGVSRAQAWEYYGLANEVVDWFLERFDPLPAKVSI